LEQLVPKITDEDDVNLDDIDTIDPDAGKGPDDVEDDVADAADDTDDTRDDQGDPEDEPGDGDQDEQHSEDGDAEDLAARGREQRRQQPERRGGRASERVRALNEQLRTEREERLALQRRFDEFAQRQANPPQPRESEDQRNARRALLSETERAAEDIRESEARMTARLNHTTLTVQDASDKSIYTAKATSDPLYKKWEPKVEAELQRLRSLGANVSRQAILEWLVGKAALESRGSKTNRTNEALGRRRLERQKVPARDSRNDATQSRRGGGRSLEDRLANQPI
jgi:hypothetical protein